MSLLLTLAMLLGLMPIMALADGGHMHYLCGGASCMEAGHTKESAMVEFTAWNYSDKLPTSEGKYYLTKNVTLQGTWSSNVSRAEIVLCLNGYNITYTGDGTYDYPVLKVDHGNEGIFAICDCKGEGVIIHQTGTKGNGVAVLSGTFNLYGGTISGNTGCGVSMMQNNKTNTSTFNMYGGKISGNGNTAIRGGGVSGERDESVFNMTGGTISGNNAKKGIYQSLGEGGGVYFGGWDDSSKFVMSGGTITGNSAEANGGGVCYEYGKEFKISGSAKITENYKGGPLSGGRVYW